ncbi:MAG: hypothetical protein KTR16_11345 [Acidiferrobacterales bacterium]|nr:hypothetical protein [Acidiferrobacterales bacterium]
MKNYLPLAILFSSAVFADIESSVEIRGESITFGTQCVGGYLFAFASLGDYRGSISIQQIFKDGVASSVPNDPIKCEVKNDN